MSIYSGNKQEKTFLLKKLGDAVTENWESQNEIEELKTADPERWERSRQFVLQMKYFEKLIQLKLKGEASKLDMEFIICIYNLFLSISN